MIAFTHDFFTKPKNILLVFSVVLMVCLIILSEHTTLLPLQRSDFLFFAVLTFLGALYRPGWIFLLFIAALPLETINLAPQEFGIALRPYQFLGALTLLAVAIRFSLKRLNFTLPRFAWYDVAMLLFVGGGFLSTLHAPDAGQAFKQALVVFSFVMLYVLVRIFVQNMDDVRRIAPFFFAGGSIVVFYGIWQNWAFMHDMAHSEVMPGRPNSTFPEADWFGIYLVFVLAALFALFSAVQAAQNTFSRRMKQCLFFFIGIMTVTTMTALILTVSRSAWLGAIAVIVVFLAIDFRKRKIFLRGVFLNGMFIVGSVVVSMLIVNVFSLTSFELENRFASISSGKQSITVSCRAHIELPAHISDVTELDRYGCRHIMIEEIAQEQSRGAFVTTVLRDDPNVQTRAMLYRKSLALIAQNPLFGIGWGSSGAFLGADARGAALNTSNIFLETWLGGGIVSLVSLLVVCGAIIVRTMRRASDYSAREIFALLGFCAIIVPNLFNAGILLGFVWVFFGVALSREGSLYP